MGRTAQGVSQVVANSWMVDRDSARGCWNAVVLEAVKQNGCGRRHSHVNGGETRFSIGRLIHRCNWRTRACAAPWRAGGLQCKFRELKFDNEKVLVRSFILLHKLNVVRSKLVGLRESPRAARGREPHRCAPASGESPCYWGRCHTSGGSARPSQSSGRRRRSTRWPQPLVRKVAGVRL